VIIVSILLRNKSCRKNVAAYNPTNVQFEESDKSTSQFNVFGKQTDPQNTGTMVVYNLMLQDGVSLMIV
jgi:hypothetical protein